jgi:adenosylcobyric acid synthase
MARAISVLGTASDVGKSLVSVALCRLLADAGFDVAPFKAQNMANQAGVTVDGLEMPRAQILQALAARQTPHVDMGPILLKPISHTGAQVIALGKAIGAQQAADYFRDTNPLREVAAQALARLLGRHRVVVLEGAGSPVELNLMDRDFVNLVPARQAGAALVLVADIDRGGVFAQVEGTLALLPERDRSRLLGVVVNRFRGDARLFDDGLRILEQRTGVPVLALLPYLDHGLDEEDHVFRMPVDRGGRRDGRLSIGAVLYPRVSNTEDLAPLLAEPDVDLTWVTDPDRVAEHDVLILPGTKATLGDLAHLTASGVAAAVLAAAARGAWILGLCGGYQMLGAELRDDAGSEGGPSRCDGLGLLPVTTVFTRDKVVRQSQVASLWPEPGHVLEGYEIHHGRTALCAQQGEALAEGGAATGWRHERTVGTYLHGILANDRWRNAFLNQIRRSKGLPSQEVCTSHPIEDRIRRWAEHVRQHLRPGAWQRIVDSLDEPTAPGSTI